MTGFDWDKFKCRCSGINKILANKQGNAPLTEKQEEKLKELEAKEKDKGLTGPQQLELTSLYAKREMSKELVLSDGCIDYLMEVYAWETEQMIPVNKESMDLMQTKKGKIAEAEAVILLSRVDKVMYQVNKDRL